MKKPVNILVTVTCVFAAFLGGFHIGRCLNRAPVQIHQLPEPAAEDALPAVPQAEADAPAQVQTPAVPKVLDINTATAEDFDALPGIGLGLAQRIIAHREEIGGFQAVEELLQVNGIGDAKLAELLDLITVETGGTK